MKFIKLRKIYRILFPKKYSQEEIFNSKLNENILITDFKIVDKHYELKTIYNKDIYIRNFLHSDYKVFQQIFNAEEYKIILSILKNNNFLNENKIFIDAGSNIGLTTLYFSLFHPFDKTFCIEPSESNFSILEKNISNSNNAESFKLYKNALSGKKNLEFIIDNDFRDGTDWSLSTKEFKGGSIKGITLNDLILENNLKEITFLKIDIEGAERFIFDAKNDLSFLNIVKIIAVEIHDEFNSRITIENILLQNNFFIFHSGELTIGVKNIYV